MLTRRAAVSVDGSAAGEQASTMLPAGAGWECWVRKLEAGFRRSG
jgi:hypothetical protein